MKLKLEHNPSLDMSDPEVTGLLGRVMVTPAISEDWWMFRVMVSENQAVLGFPKFGTIGVGFAQEEDWNTNLPARCSAEYIWKHIRDNKGDDSIPDERCVEAIRLIQQAAKAII